MQTRSVQFAKYVLNTLAIQLFAFLASIAITIITARVLGPAGRGQYTVLTQTTTIAFVIAELGLGHSVVYYLGTKKLSLKEVASSILIFQIFLGLGIALLILLVTYLFQDIIYANIPPQYLWVMAALVPIMLITSSQQSMIQGLYKIPLYNILGIIQVAVILLMLIMLTIIVSWALLGAVIAWTCGVIVAFLVTLVVIIRAKGISFPGIKLEKTVLLLSFGIKSYVGNFLKYLQYRVDIFILAYFVSSAAVGYYSVSHAVAEVVWQIPNAIQTVLFPRIASLTSSAAKGFTPVVCRQTVLITSVTCLLLFIAANLIVTFVFGEEYYPSITPLAILLPGVFMLSIWKVLHADIVARGYPQLYSYSAGASAVIMIGLDFILIPLWGINGAAVACTVAYCASTILIIYFYLHISRNSIRDIFIPEASDFSLYKKMWASLITKPDR